MNICYNCFGEKEEGERYCPVCGFDSQSQTNKYPIALPYGSVLDGRYITGRILGQGGFGITYIAQDWKTKDVVALKEYMPDTLASRVDAVMVSAYSGKRKENFEYGKKCFLDEAKTLAEFIGNPNIVRVHNYFEENGTAYFVMDYIKGSSFQEYIMQHGGRISWQDAKRILFPVMDALDEVHEKGIIHRDVTPDNIFITEEQTVKLLDFGAARYSWGNQSQSLDIILKHGYAPREQYSRHGRQGPYTDVYSLAACFYFCVTGRVPPDSIDRPEEYLQAPSSMGINLPVHAEDAILKSLSIQAADRFQSMKVFRDALADKEEKKGEKKKEEEDRKKEEDLKKEKGDKGKKEERKKEKEGDGKKVEITGWRKPAIVGAAAMIVVCCIAMAIQSRNSNRSSDLAEKESRLKSVSEESSPVFEESGTGIGDTLEEEGFVIKGNTSGNLNNWGIAVEDKTHIYVSILYQEGQCRIEKLSKYSDESETLLEGGQIKALNLYDDQIYYMEDGKTINRINKDGSGGEKVLEIDKLSKFSIMNDYLYYCIEVGKDSFDLYRTDLEGLKREKIVSGIAGETQYMVEGNWVYYWDGEDSALYKMRLDGTEEILLSEKPGFMPTVIDDWIYFHDQRGIYRLHKDGSGQEQIFSGSPAGKIWNMNILNDFIFFITDQYEDELTLCQIKNGDTEVEKLYSINKNDGSICALNTLEQYVTFYDLNNTTEFSLGIMDFSETD